ncbi:MAG: hypothetical protein IPM31_14450 [Anaerolineae bacterium]|nr:hypothetical protein [Anaerolineae bacterium]
MIFLNAVHDQLGPRLAFWVNTILTDFNMDSYAAEMAKQGRDPKDTEGLSNFAFIGFLNPDRSLKPAMEVWDGFRNP